MDKPKIIYCPNPRCKCEILEPIVINDFSTSPKRTYKGCPNCFSEVNLVTSQVQEIEPKSIFIKNGEKKSSPCNHYSEYLASRTKGNPIPEECLFCPKLLVCTENVNI